MLLLSSLETRRCDIIKSVPKALWCNEPKGSNSRHSALNKKYRCVRDYPNSLRFTLIFIYPRLCLEQSTNLERRCSMGDQLKTLEMRFDGTVTDRREFLKQIRSAVMGLTGEMMTLDALINEIAKNIFDHAHGLGSLVIKPVDGSFEFQIKDDGQKDHDFEHCSAHPRLAGSGVNFGVGLRTIRELAQSLGVDLQIDPSKGFSYSGIYIPRKHVD